MTPKIEAVPVDGLTGSSGLSLYARALAPLYGITRQRVNASTGRGASTSSKPQSAADIVSAVSRDDLTTKWPMSGRFDSQRDSRRRLRGRQAHP